MRVQGRDASREITIAIRHLSRWQLHDVVLICRGGGSLEDLWAFNEESVARAVAACSIPTISGVGHETDFTICDFVADLRAPTPSAAAEIVIRAKSEICTQVDHMTRRVRHVVESRVRNYRHELRHLASSDRLGSCRAASRLRRERLDRSRVTLFRMLEARARSMRSPTRRDQRSAAAFSVRRSHANANASAPPPPRSAPSPRSPSSRAATPSPSRARNAASASRSWTSTRSRSANRSKCS